MKPLALLTWLRGDGPLRQVTVDRPDLQGRVRILNVHSKGKAIGKDVDFEKIARRTPGFTGADLQNLMNEAAIMAARPCAAAGAGSASECRQQRCSARAAEGAWEAGDVLPRQ